MTPEKAKHRLLEGSISVSELSDEKCRIILRDFIRHFRSALTSLENDRLRKLSKIKKLKINVGNKSLLPEEK